MPPLIANGKTNGIKSLKTTINKLPSVQKKPRLQRSKNGCLSCRKLKIKCNEVKPTCEYCVQTGRQCIYQVLPQVKLIRRQNKKNKKHSVVNDPDISSVSSVSSINGLEEASTDSCLINNKPLQKLNSLSYQLKVTPFELQLLKFYLDFAPDFFTFNINSQAGEFWSNVIPSLWCCSDLIKNSIYAISSVRILASYDANDASKVYFQEEHGMSSQLISTSGLIKSNGRVNVYEEATKYVKNTLNLVEMYKSMISYTDDKQSLLCDNEELVGQLFVAKKLVTGCRLIHPSITENELNINEKNSVLLDVMNNTHDFFDKVGPFIKMLENTKYHNIGLFDNMELKVSDLEKYQDLFFINKLKDYITENSSPIDVSQIVYLDAIFKFESGCRRALCYRFPISLFKIIVEIAFDQDFIDLLKNKDHIAMKIIYNVCCLNTIFHYKLYGKSEFYGEFIDYYENYSKEKFPDTNGFEDDIDANLHEWVNARIKNKLPYDLNIITHIGRPVDEYLKGEKLQVINYEAYPKVFF